MGKLKDFYTVVNSKELEKALKDIKQKQDNCNHVVPFYSELKDLGFTDEHILFDYEFCPKCGAKVKK